MDEQLTLTLTLSRDEEMMRLINYIQKMGYGEILIKVRKGKPYQIVRSEKSILLSSDDSKDKKTYGG